MDIGDDEFAGANQRAGVRLATTPRAVAVHYDGENDQIVVRLSNDVELAFRPHSAQGLDGARSEKLSSIEISPSGLGLHFPDLDVDLYLPSLIENLLGSRRWMAAAMGRAGGSVSSDAKTAAARSNGRRGGRPVKG
jgi:uncharacterized protein DUF2442